MLLAVLLLRAGQLVPVDELIERMWDGDPSANPRADLHMCVNRLRKASARRDVLRPGRAPMGNSSRRVGWTSRGSRDLVGAANRGDRWAEASLLRRDRGSRQDTLKVYCAHRVRGLFPDGQLYVNPCDNALDWPVRSWRRPSGSCGSARRAGRGRMRGDRHPPELLADRRALIVLDNAASADLIRPLLPGSTAAWSWSSAANWKARTRTEQPLKIVREPMQRLAEARALQVLGVIHQAANDIDEARLRMARPISAYRSSRVQTRLQSMSGDT